MKKYELTINGKPYNIHVSKFTSEEATLRINGKVYTVQVNDIEDTSPGVQKKEPAKDAAAAKPKAAPSRPAAAPTAAPAPAAAPSDGGSGAVMAPIPGAVMEVFVNEGDTVTVGQAVLKMEAMKMENIINSEVEGKVATIMVKPGDAVAQGQKLIVLK